MIRWCLVALALPAAVFCEPPETYEPDPESVLRLIRNDKLDLMAKGPATA